MKFLLVAAALLLVSASQASAQTPDAQLKSQLDGLGYKYDLTGNGDFRLIISTDQVAPGRRQAVLLFSNPSPSPLGGQVRELITVAYNSTTPPPSSLAVTLAAANEAFADAGAWHFSTSSDGSHLAILSIWFPVDAPPSVIDTAIKLAAVQGDRIEKSLSDTDRR